MTCETQTDTITAALDVSQPLLDVDMERHHVHVWDASNARHRRLQRRRMYPLLATRTSTDSFLLS